MLRNAQELQRHSFGRAVQAGWGTCGGDCGRATQPRAHEKHKHQLSGMRSRICAVKLIPPVYDVANAVTPATSVPTVTLTPPSDLASAKA